MQGTVPWRKGAVVGGQRVGGTPWTHLTHRCSVPSRCSETARCTDVFQLLL